MTVDISDLQERVRELEAELDLWQERCATEAEAQIEQRKRAEDAEAELARLKAQEPVAWYDPADFTRTASNKTAKEYAPLYAAPPAQGE